MVEPEPPYKPEEVIQIDFRIWATKKQLACLKAFLIDNKIKYGKVE
jgi:hypothetical protein